MSDYKLIGSKSVYNGNVMDFWECDVELPDGKVAKWDLVHHSGGAAALPVDDDGNIILVRQYRLGVDRELLEIPAGKAEPGEDPLETVKREMEEEIGYVAGHIEKMMDFCPAPAYSQENTAVYLATELKKTRVNPDEDEFVTIERYSPDALKDMIRNGEIVDGKTISAVTAYLAIFFSRN
ncbi:MAG: NUDIX hydrolase [Eubacterium sp.]|nr:NUDIX hydrolase [Eubacterium sp.]